MAPPLPPPPLNEDVITQILRRLPPYEPEHLFRAALVCKSWLRVIFDDGFLRVYRDFHGAPPLLGCIHSYFRRFASTTLVPDFPVPGSEYRVPLDCRHGLVLFEARQGKSKLHIVWDPVTGVQHDVPKPRKLPWKPCHAAVLCAAYRCDHLDCHGRPFRLVFLDIKRIRDHVLLVKVRVYSSVTRVWDVPLSIKHTSQGTSNYFAYTPEPGAAIGDEIYFADRHLNTILKYDLGKNCLSMINPPSPILGNTVLTAMENSSLGFACIEGSSLHTWSRKVHSEGAALWVQCRVIELETMLPVSNPSFYPPAVVASAKGVCTIFVTTDVGLFTVELNSGKVIKVAKPGSYSFFHYLSYYTPNHARGRLLSLARQMNSDVPSSSGRTVKRTKPLP